MPGGVIEESRVLQGVMLNKDITHPRMKRRIENPRILLLDCPLEYTKGESQVGKQTTNMSSFEYIVRFIIVTDNFSLDRH